MRNTRRFLLLLICGWSLGACAGGKKDSQAQPKNQPDPAVAGATPGAAPGEAEAEKKKQELAAAIDRGIKQKEFLLKLVVDDSALARIDAVTFDVISATTAEAAKLEQMGSAKYRDSRKKDRGPDESDGNTLTRVFKKGGKFEINVPTIPATDTILLWAELDAPTSGNDSRMLMVPLVLDKSDPAKGPLANPITVKLTANGWVRES